MKTYLSFTFDNGVVEDIPDQTWCSWKLVHILGPPFDIFAKYWLQSEILNFKKAHDIVLAPGIEWAQAQWPFFKVES